MDRMRESLFAILGDLTGLSFLDLFSGSGIIGIEAASRGAEPVFLVEKDRRKRNTLLDNIRFVESEIDVRVMDARQFIRRGAGRFDIIFLDPPFAMAGKPKLIDSISGASLLESGGTLIIHLPRQENLPDRIASLALADRRLYGGSCLAFYKTRQAYYEH
jgi:16S rRNA (guanine(966)-N(2))-methyltransferase RsmD